MKLFIICANITADNKILYVSVGWEGWLFIAAYSILALKSLQQLTLSFLGGMGEVPYNNISNEINSDKNKSLKISRSDFWSHF